MKSCMGEYLTPNRLLVFVSFKEVVQQGYFSIHNFFLDLSQESVKPESLCLAPRASAIKAS